MVGKNVKLEKILQLEDLFLFEEISHLKHAVGIIALEISISRG